MEPVHQAALGVGADRHLIEVGADRDRARRQRAGAVAAGRRLAAGAGAATAARSRPSAAEQHRVQTGQRRRSHCVSWCNRHRQQSLPRRPQARRGRAARCSRRGAEQRAARSACAGRRCGSTGEVRHDTPCRPDGRQPAQRRRGARACAAPTHRRPAADSRARIDRRPTCSCPPAPGAGSLRLGWSPSRAARRRPALVGGPVSASLTKRRQAGIRSRGAGIRRGGTRAQRCIPDPARPAWPDRRAVVRAGRPMDRRGTVVATRPCCWRWSW